MDTVTVRVPAGLERWSFVLGQLGEAQVRLRQLSRRVPAYRFLIQFALENVVDAIAVIEEEIASSIVEVEMTDAR